VVAKRTVNRWAVPRLAIDGQERRVLALLAIAYWRPIGPPAIHQMKRASQALSRGDRPLAGMLIAHIGLPRLDEDERIAFRLFAAERLLNASVSPRDLMKGLGLDPWPLDRWRR